MAVFIQALSLFSMQPVIVYKAKVWIDANFRVLWLFVPITLVSTPLGQMVSYRVPTDIVQAVAGVLVVFVACWEIYGKRGWLLGFCKKSTSETKGGNTDVKEVCKAETRQSSTNVTSDNNVQDTEQVAPTDNTNPKSPDEESPQDDNNDEITTLKDSNTEAKEASSNPQTISSVYASMAVESPNDDQEARAVEDSNEQFKVGLNKATWITLLAGGASGFLGGMVGKMAQQ